MKVLIIKIGAIGDVIMALPMARAVRKQAHSVHVTWVCGKRVAPLIRASGLAERVIPINEDRLALEIPKVWWQLGFERFDRVLCAHRDWRYQLFTHLRGTRWDPRPGIYHGVEYLRMIGSTELEWPKLKLPEVDISAEIVLAPGGMRDEIPGRGLRMWPIQRYAELAARLNQRIILVGGSQDHWVVDYFDGAIDCVGKLSLLETIAVMQKAKLVITHDGGPLHMAILAKTDVVGLFGPTDPNQFLPPGVSAVTANAFCSPCYDGKYYANCAHQSCMRNISVDQVYKRVQCVLR